MGKSGPGDDRATETYRTLRERIVSGELPPGRRVIERDLAEELGVSRVPVREALRRLTADGLVVLVPRQGALVAPLSPADVDDLFDVRESLEELAARRAAERAEPEALARMSALLVEARRAKRRDERAFARANAAFHAEIVAAAGNALLDAMMGPLAVQLQRLFRLTAERDAGQQCAEHGELYEAIAAGDAGRAAELARRHAASGRADSLAAAAEWTDPGFDPVAATKSRRRGGGRGA